MRILFSASRKQRQALLPDLTICHELMLMNAERWRPRPTYTADCERGAGGWRHGEQPLEGDN
jgi:hypothetical protein